MLLLLQLTTVSHLCTHCCTTNPQQIAVIGYGLNLSWLTWLLSLHTVKCQMRHTSRVRWQKKC